MKTVEIHYIGFENEEKASKNANYPNDGLFIVTVEKTKMSDLRFVDKNIEFNFCIAPGNVAEKVLSNKLTTTFPEQEEPKKEYSQDFILEFARILLNRKHV